MHERPRNRHPAARARLRPDQQTERRGCLGSRLGRAVEQPDHDQRDEPPPDDDQDRAEQHPDPAGTGLETGRPCDPAHRDREQRSIMPDRGQPVAPIRCGLALRRRAEMGGDRGPQLHHHDPQKHRDDEADNVGSASHRRPDAARTAERAPLRAAERRDQRQPAQPTHQIRGAIVIDTQQPQAARVGRQQHAADRQHYPGRNVGIDHDLDRQAVSAGPERGRPAASPQSRISRPAPAPARDARRQPAGGASGASPVAGSLGFGRVRRSCRQTRGRPAQHEGGKAIEQQRRAQDQGKRPGDIEDEATFGGSLVIRRSQFRSRYRSGIVRSAVPTSSPRRCGSRSTGSSICAARLSGFSVTAAGFPASFLGAAGSVGRLARRALLPPGRDRPPWRSSAMSRSAGPALPGPARPKARAAPRQGSARHRSGRKGSRPVAPTLSPVRPDSDERQASDKTGRQEKTQAHSADSLAAEIGRFGVLRLCPMRARHRYRDHRDRRAGPARPAAVDPVSYAGRHRARHHLGARRARSDDRRVDRRRAAGEPGPAFHARPRSGWSRAPISPARSPARCCSAI